LKLSGGAFMEDNLHSLICCEKAIESDASYVSQETEKVDLGKRMHKEKMKTYFLRTLMHKLFTRATYDFWWEDDCYNVYDDIDDEYEEPIIINQAVVPAREINLDNEHVDFPWHNHSEDDFISLNEKLQGLLSEAISCKDKKSVIRFKKKHKEVYEAYFLRPLMVFEKDGSNRYSFGSDGRHRIFVAQKSDGLLPVWIVRHAKVSRLPLDQYKKRIAIGEWRFYNFDPPPLASCDAG